MTSWNGFLDNYLLRCTYKGNNKSVTNKYAAILNKKGTVWAKSSGMEELKVEDILRIFDNHVDGIEATVLNKKVSELILVIMDYFILLNVSS